MHFADYLVVDPGKELSILLKLLEQKPLHVFFNKASTGSDGRGNSLRNFEPSQ